MAGGIEMAAARLGPQHRTGGNIPPSRPRGVAPRTLPPAPPVRGPLSRSQREAVLRSAYDREVRLETNAAPDSVVRWLPGVLARADQIRAAGRTPRVLRYERDFSARRMVVTVTAVR